MVSPIMARFSGSVVSSACVTWKSHDLPTIVATGATGHGKRAELGVLQRDVVHAAEEAEVLRIRARPAALDVVDADGIEARGQTDLVFHRKRHAFALGAVAQCRVVNLDGSPHSDIMR